MSQLSLRNVPASRQTDFVYDSSPTANRRILGRCGDNLNEAELKAKQVSRAEEEENVEPPDDAGSSSG